MRLDGELVTDVKAIIGSKGNLTRAVEDGLRLLVAGATGRAVARRGRGGGQVFTPADLYPLFADDKQLAEDIRVFLITKELDATTISELVALIERARQYGKAQSAEAMTTETNDTHIPGS